MFTTTVNQGGSTITPSPNTGAIITWNISNGAGEVDFINSWNSYNWAGFYFYNANNGGSITSSTVPICKIRGDTSVFNSSLIINESTGTGAGPNSGSLVIQHQDNYGTSSISFPSKINNGSDYGYIQYKEAYNGSNENAKLVIGIENDATTDSIVLYSSGGNGYIGINTYTPSYALDVNGTLNAPSGIAGTIYGSTDTYGIKGLYFNIANGYHNESVSTFNGLSAYTGTTNPYGYTNDLSNLSSSTNGKVAVNTSTVLSSMHYGYFFTGNNSGSFTFYLASDDGSYMWIGDNALPNYASTSNCLINNGGGHGTVTVSNSTTLSSNTYYPIRILYGNSGGGSDLQFSFTLPGSSTRIYNGSGYYYSKSGISCLNLTDKWLSLENCYRGKVGNYISSIDYGCASSSGISSGTNAIGISVGTGDDATDCYRFKL
jgi:hypothetical protein